MNETLYSSDLVSLQIRANESNTRKIVRSILWRYAPSSAKTVCNAMKRLSKLVPSFTGYIYLVLPKEYSILGSGRTNVLLGWTYLFNRDFRDLSVILGSFFLPTISLAKNLGTSEILAADALVKLANFQSGSGPKDLPRSIVRNF